MTEFIASPHHKYMSTINRKRGSHDDNDDDEGPLIQNFKRIRGDPGVENVNLQLGVNVADINSGVARRFTGFRPLDATTLQQNAEVLNRTYQAQIESLRQQHVTQLDVKNKDLAQMSVLNSKLLEEYKRLSSENTTMAEENRVLKKAVQFQDQKQKDAAGQISQYELIVKSAVEHIQRVEASNRELMQELAALRQQSLFSSHNSDIF
jgi:hypothetical protein